MRHFHSENDDLLGDCRSAKDFSQARAPPRAPANMRGPNHANFKAPARDRSAGSAKQAATGDLWCFLVLAFLAFGGYGVWSVPAHDRTLANFESKVHYVVRALGGELEKENHDLASNLANEKKKEVDLRMGENTLKKDLEQAHQKEEMLEKRLAAKESGFQSAQQDIVRARSDLQNWHQKTDALEKRLSSVQEDVVQKQRALQQSRHETTKAQEHARQLEKAIAGDRRKIAGLEAASKHLRGELQNAKSWKEATVQKFRRYRDAEATLMKSIDVESADAESEESD